jgi:hypothetical protein
MTIPEKEGMAYASKFNHGGAPTHARVSQELSTKISHYDNDRNRLRFLEVLYAEVLSQSDKHELVCQMERGCNSCSRYEMALFVIKDKLENLISHYQEPIVVHDAFTIDEVAIINRNIYMAIESLKREEQTNERIICELQDLKNQLTLGKKRWYELLMGKGLALVRDNAAERFIIVPLFDGLIKGVKFLGDNISLLIPQ